MELLSPASLWWLLALGVLLLLPKLRIPRQQVPSATIHFWREARAAEAAQPRVRLRRHLLLLLQAAALLAIVAALARPVLLTRPREVAVIVDLSASMAAADAGGTRLDRARAEARRLIGELPFGSRVRLLGADATVHSNPPVARGSDQLRSMLDGLQPGRGTAALDAAVQVARGAGAREILVLSDAPDAPADPDVRVIAVGTPAPNVAVTLFAARRLVTSPLDVEAVVELRSFADATTSTVLTISDRTGDTYREQVALEPGAVVRRALTFEARDGSITARIEIADALEADNERTLALPMATRVAVQGAVSEFVRASLEANTAVTLVADPAGADVIVCAECDDVPAGSPGVLLVSPSRAAVPSDAEPMTAAGRTVGSSWLRHQQRIVRLALDSTDPATVRDSLFPVAVAESLAWVAGAVAPGDGRFPLVESDLRRPPVSRDAPARAQASSDAGRLPLATTLLIVALLLVCVEWAVASRLGTTPSLAVRSIVLLCLAGAALGVALPFGRSAVSVIFAIDRSASMSAAAQLTAERWVTAAADRMRPGDRAGIVSFGEDALVQRPLAASLPAASSTTMVGSRSTDIAAAIRVARAVADGDGARRIVVVSDGGATRGDAVAESRAAAASGIAVDAVPAVDPRSGAVHVSRVTAPPAVRAGDRFEVAVTVEGPPRGTVPIVLFRDGVELVRERVSLDRDGIGVARTSDRVSDDAVVTYTAAAGADPLPEEAGAGAAVVASLERPVLYVAASRPASAGTGLAVEHTTIGRLAASPERLAKHAAVVLDGVNADDISAELARALVEYVKKTGGGLLVRGGDAVLGPAGYPQSPLDAALPVDFRARGGSRSADMAFVVAFDKSGSMADTADGTSKIELARRAVLAVRDVLPAGDSLGVIAFDAAPSTVTRLGPSPAAGALAERLGALAPHGATRISPAVALAREWLSASAAARKHILLITDGRSDEGDAAEVIAQLRAREADVTIVAVGDDSDRDFFRVLAERTGASVYFPSDLGDLPRIVAREAARTSGGSLVRERFEPRVASAHPILRGLEAFPPLDSYVAGAARPDAVTVLASHLGDPVLAVSQYGLGRVVVLTTGGRNAGEAFDRMWTQAIGWAAASGNDSPLDVRVSSRDDGALVSVDAVASDGSFINGLRGDVTVRAPSGDVRTVALDQVGPGQYAAPAVLDERGTHVFSAVLRDDTGANEHLLRSAFYWSAPAERSRPAGGRAVLTSIAAAGNGRLLLDNESPFDLPRPLGYRDVSSPLAALALILFLLDIARRRGVSWEIFRRRARVEATA